MPTKQKSMPKTLTAAPTPTGNENLRVTLDKKIYGRAERYQDAKGLLSMQEVVRLAMSFFLDKQGY